MPFELNSDNRPITFLVAVIIGLAARRLAKIQNKNRNKQLYENMETQPAGVVTQVWLKNLIRISIPFQYSLIFEIMLSMIGLVVLDRILPDLVFLYVILIGLAGMLRFSLHTRKIVYLTNLSPAKYAEVCDYYNTNLTELVDQCQKDPEISSYLDSRPAFLRKLIINKVRRLKPIKFN